MPYNYSKFELQGKYDEVFGRICGDIDVNGNEIEKSPNKKYFKIRYTLNLLPAATYEENASGGVSDLLEVLAESEEQSIFDSKIVKDFYDFQWNTFAFKIHFFGFMQHLIYLVLFVAYIDRVYLNRDFSVRVTLIWMMAICLMYPAFYDGL